jgi:hypothetical protein
MCGSGSLMTVDAIDGMDTSGVFQWCFGSEIPAEPKDQTSVLPSEKAEKTRKAVK